MALDRLGWSFAVRFIMSLHAESEQARGQVCPVPVKAGRVLLLYRSQIPSQSHTIAPEQTTADKR